MSQLLGGIEAGGTKFICAVSTKDCQPMASTRIATTDPTTTLAAVIDFFKPYAQDMLGIGVGCFGPVERNPARRDFGTITTTPKLAWRDVNIVAALKKAFALPLVFDTDVNAAAVGEYYFGAGQGVDHLLYLTVGTGIGGGLLLSGQPYHGVMHLELGHLLLARELDDDYVGCCPDHGDCLEGLASGVALMQRFAIDDMRVLSTHPAALNLQARYLAKALVNYTCCLSPERIILGGGVMQCSALLPLIRREFIKQMAGYVSNDAVNHDSYIQMAGLEQQAGIRGALAMIGLHLKLLTEEKND